MTATGSVDRYAFSDPNSYIGEAIYNDINCYGFKSLTIIPPNIEMNTILYVSINTEKPIAMIVSNITSYFEGTVIEYLMFNQQFQPFPQQLFDIPSYCDI